MDTLPSAETGGLRARPRRAPKFQISSCIVTVPLESCLLTLPPSSPDKKEVTFCELCLCHPLALLWRNPSCKIQTPEGERNTQDTVFLALGLDNPNDPHSVAVLKSGCKVPREFPKPSSFS